MTASRQEQSSLRAGERHSTTAGSRLQSNPRLRHVKPPSDRLCQRASEITCCRSSRGTRLLRGSVFDPRPDTEPQAHRESGGRGTDYRTHPTLCPPSPLWSVLSRFLRHSCSLTLRIRSATLCFPCGRKRDTSHFTNPRRASRPATGTPFREASGQPTQRSRKAKVEVEVERRSGTASQPSSTSRKLKHKLPDGCGRAEGAGPQAGGQRHQPPQPGSVLCPFRAVSRRPLRRSW